MTECIIFEIFVCFIVEEKEETRRVRMKMKHNRKVLFITSIHISEKCYHHKYSQGFFHNTTVWVRHIHIDKGKCVKWKKIKSLFLPIALTEKKQLISLLQTFNTVPPDSIGPRSARSVDKTREGKKGNRKKLTLCSGESGSKCRKPIVAVSLIRQVFGDLTVFIGRVWEQSTDINFIRWTF